MTADQIDELLTEFRAKAEPLGAVVRWVTSDVEAGSVAAAWAAELGAERIVLARELQESKPEFCRGLQSASLAVETAESAEQLRDAPLGASLAVMAIAETGSTLLAESSLADRAVGMLTLAQIIICPVTSLVASLDDVAPVLRRIATAPGASFATLITGPSRTADIERVLTIGVQGPGKVMVIFVDELKAG